MREVIHKAIWGHQDFSIKVRGQDNSRSNAEIDIYQWLVSVACPNDPVFPLIYSEIKYLTLDPGSTFGEMHYACMCLYYFFKS